MKFLLRITAFVLICTISACSIGKIGGIDGPTAIFVSDKKSNSSEITPEIVQAQELEKRVTAAILSHNASGYLSGECSGEAHIIIGTENENKVVYVLTMYGEYGFQDGNFVKISGSGVIPARITFDESGNAAEYETPMDGSYYEKSIKKIFPKKYHNLVLKADAHYDILKEQEVDYAKKYLKQIGREAKIGEYGDFEHKTLTDMGISVEVSNLLTATKSNNNYPYWIGNQEFIEDGVRYVYSMELENDIISCTKTNYESGNIVAHTQYDAKTGKVLR